MHIRFCSPSLQRWSATKRLMVGAAVLALVVGTFTTSLIFPRSAAAASGNLQGVNVTPGANASASSENTGTEQLASKAIDGVIAGFPGDSTKEWATVHGKAGSWLNLQWSSLQTTNEIILYDRPNLNDQITGGNIQFGNSSTVSFGALNNDGTPTTLVFAVRSFTNLRLNITSVSGSTINVGLAEIQVFSATPTLVPNVLGIDQDSATTKINQAGLVLGSVTQDNTCKDVAGTVLTQNPTAGFEVVVGSAVNIRVSSGTDKNSNPCTSFP